MNPSTLLILSFALMLGGVSINDRFKYGVGRKASLGRISAALVFTVGFLIFCLLIASFFLMGRD